MKPRRLPSSLPRPTSKALFPSLVGIVLLFAFVLRFWGVSWDQGTHLHPDERFITMVANDTRVPTSLGQYFNTAESPMSPYNTNPGKGGYAYGTFPLFLTKVTGDVFEHNNFFPLNLVKDGLAKAFAGSAGAWNGYDRIDLVGRFWSALFSTGTVLMVFLTGKLLYNRRVGLLAALLMATSVMDIQLAHYFTVDSFLTFFAAFTLYYCVRIVKFGRWSDFALAGLGLGFATACKLSGAFLAPIVLLAFVWRLRGPAIDVLRSERLLPGGRASSEPEILDEADEPRRSTDWMPLASPVFGLVLATLAAFLVFRISEPYAFEGPHFWNIMPSQKYLDDMQNLIGLQSGGNVPFNWEWVGRTPYLFPLQNIVLWGMGLPLGIAACVAFLWASWRLLWRRDVINLLLLVWIASYFLFWGRQFNLTARYFLPLYPALVLLAAQALGEMWQLANSAKLHEFVQRRFARLRPATPVILRGAVIGVTAGTVLWALAFTSIYRRPLTRVEASAWMLDNLPAQSVVTHETWDDGLPFNVQGQPAKDIAGCRTPAECVPSESGRAPDVYVLDIEPYGDDLSSPKSTMLDALNRTDYISLSSNRLYASIPRAPAKWPMTSNYYKLLLEDKLPGFRLVKTFTSYPTVFGVSINDDAAEGNFTVYDHPKVLLYEKTPDYSPERLMAAVGDGVCTQSAVSELAPANADQNALQLRPEDCQTQRAGGTWSSIFDPGSLSNRLPVITWLLVIEIMSLAVLPLGLFVFRALPDRGYLLAKPLGLLAVSWLVWLGASVKLFHFERESIFAMLVLVIVAGAVVARLTRNDLLAYVREHWRRILLYEAIFLGAFLFFYWIRTLDPDLWHPARGGEKPMELAYLNAVTRSTTMPPYDPWFAGGYLNYYYFGQFMTATLIKLTGILPEIAFNLAVPLFFAMTAGAAFSVVYNLTEATRRRVRWRPGFKRIGGGGPLVAGVLGVVLVAIIGNLNGVYQTAERFTNVSDWHAGDGVFFVSGFVGMLGGIWKTIVVGGVHLQPFGFWDSSRMMPPQSSITEFPFFTFLFADLHAHLMAIPYDVAILGVALALVLTNRKDIPSARQRQVVSWLGVGVLGLLIGALRPINSWDYPPFLLIGIAAVFIAEWSDAGHIDWPAAGRAAAKAVVLAVVSIVFFLPFWSNYHLFYTGFHATASNQQDRFTPFHQYLAHFGILLFAAGTLIATLGWRFFRRRPQTKVVLYLGVVVTILATIVVGMALSGESDRLPITFKGLSATSFLDDLFTNNIPVVAFSIAVIALLGVLAWRELRRNRSDAPLRLFLLAIVAVALALSAMVDIITLDGDIERMNTVFKFYIHVWLLLAIAGAFGVWYIFAALGWRPLRLSRGVGGLDPPKAVWAIALVILVGGGLIYPIFGTRNRVDTSERFPEYTSHTNDGMNYMQYANFGDEFGDLDLSYDYDAIQWMRENVQGSPVIVEGQTPNYRWGSRFSIYTGLPTVIGWGWHQKQQRGEFQTMIDVRERDLRDFYSSPTIQPAVDFLRKYQVEYVIVGQLEHAYYPGQGLLKFQAMAGRELDLVFENDGVQIYRVVELPPLIPSSVIAQ